MDILKRIVFYREGIEICVDVNKSLYEKIEVDIVNNDKVLATIKINKFELGVYSLESGTVVLETDGGIDYVFEFNNGLMINAITKANIECTKKMLDELLIEDEDIK